MKILLPTDGSKSSLNAAKYVAKMAKNSRSPVSVTLISVHDDMGLGHVKQFVANDVVDDGWDDDFHWCSFYGRIQFFIIRILVIYKKS